MDEQTTPWPPRLPGDEHTRPVRRRRNLWPWFIFLLIVAGLVLWLHPWAKKAAGPHAGATPPVAVAVAPVAPGSMDVVLTELGTVTPLATVTVQSQVSGYLQQVNFTEGQEVAKGFLLALVDPRPYEVLLEQYTAQLARDTAALSQAQMDLTRYQTLGRQQSIAKQTLDDQKFTVAQDQATIKIDQAQIDTEKLNITYCHITSPGGWAGGTAAGGRGQLRHVVADQRAGGDHADQADLGDLHGGRGRHPANPGEAERQHVAGGGRV